MLIRGKVWKFGDDIDTDVIIPARYLVTFEPEELAKHVMEDIDPTFASKVQPGDIIVAGKNFGCGSSREHAPIAIKGAGVAAVVAESYARIFFRNAINIGLPVIDAAEAAREAETGDILEIDTEEGEILNTRTGKTYRAARYDDFIQDIINAGGLMEAVTRRVQERRGEQQPS
ncbi:3-isopropylmalate dehydratase small subunit [Sphaerobacter sp.]|uniref:3-isopropylmalate dehydratase small subunit n=1 Tax=Sphaerobacter sp. TaxID=2099654 RepID=UPI001E188F6B|nr:3-isopropylmalate dehydratase small subunit [Sphaerobacter sp.]MBX5446511.1 3-isopropylmalate dehydratase small subunit [Sphaerobacter sp.]